MTIRILNYGLGTNSTALAIEATKRGIFFEIIVTADTGDERKRSYEYAEEFNTWLVANGQPSLSWVKWIRQDGTFIPISEIALARRELPSKAYGLSGCTTKWKQQPVDKFLHAHPIVLAAWARGEKVERWIGYDADEPGRAERMLAKDPQPEIWMRDGKIVQKPRGADARGAKLVPGWRWMCPLVDWDMGREECLDAIDASGLSRPGKSSCFLCPSMKKHEILQMAREEPEEMARALAVEDAARESGNLQTVKGLGRSFSWREFLEGQKEASCAREVVEAECGCFDG